MLQEPVIVLHSDSEGKPHVFYQIIYSSDLENE